MNIFYIFPEIIVFAVALIVLITGSVSVSIFGLFLSFITSAVLFTFSGAIFSSTYTIDPFSNLFKLASVAIGIIILLMSDEYAKKFIKTNINEFYALIIFAVLGMMFLTSSSNLIMIFISMEFLSLTSYILAGYLKGDKKSAESSLKYLLFGVAASAVMLYGMSFIYGITGTLNIYEISGVIAKLGYSPLLYLSLLMMFAGFGFKIAMVPFHLWMPDVFEGAPTPVVAFLSVGPKIAGFAVLLRFLIIAFLPFANEWKILIAVFSVITMTLGNLVAINQTNIKRMLAYSGISQVGYILIGLVALSSGFSVPSMLFYLLAYVFMNLGAFAVIITYSNQIGSDLIDDYRGMSERSPFLALMLTVFLLSLAGIPPLAGFVAKFYIFAAAIESGYLWLAIIAVINTVVSIYYYMNVTRVMYFSKTADDSKIIISKNLEYAIIGCVLFVVVLGIYPAPLFLITEIASRMLF